MFGNRQKNESKKELKTNAGNMVSAGKHLYQSNVGKRALERAGKNKNLKGHISEIMMCDRFNSNPGNVLQGKKAVLTKSPTAIRDDIVIMKKGRVAGRMQIKDTISKSGIQDTINKVQKGQYKGTKLMGTTETQKAYAKEIAKKNQKLGKKITQQMTSTGVSSAETELIAAKTLGGGLAKNGSKIMKQAGNSAKMGAVFSAGMETFRSVNDVRKGEKDVPKAVTSIAKETVRGGASACVADAATTMTTIAVASTPMAPAAPAAGLVVGSVAGTATDKIIRTAEHMANEKILSNKRQESYENTRQKRFLEKNRNVIP